MESGEKKNHECSFASSHWCQEVSEYILAARSNLTVHPFQHSRGKSLLVAKIGREKKGTIILSGRGVGGGSSQPYIFFGGEGGRGEEELFLSPISLNEMFHPSPAAKQEWVCVWGKGHFVAIICILSGHTHTPRYMGHPGGSLGRNIEVDTADFQSWFILRSAFIQ